MSQDTRAVLICGAKSISGYGGYETFVSRLAEYLQGCPGIQLYIACKANGQGSMDETKLPGATQVSDQEFIYCGARCFKLSVPNLGAASAICYDLIAVRFFLNYCKQQGITSPALYILTCRIGPWMRGILKKVRKLNGTIFLNPDGHEWKRSKWSLPVRKYWKLSERLMVKHADCIICDSKRIEAYIQKEYASYAPQTTFIPYGAETVKFPLPDSTVLEMNTWLKKNGTLPGSYYLVVARFVPENNIETILREYMISATKKQLVLIMNENPPLLRKLQQRLDFQRDSRIHFAGTVYNQPLLSAIRSQAYGYIHGHEMGGTNPSLLEAMAATPLNLLLDVEFNREVGEDTVLYWTKAPGSLSALLDQAEQMTIAEREQLGERAKARIQQAYSWSHIADAYSEIWRMT